MNELYQVLGTSKQAHWQMMRRLSKQQEDKQIVIQNILAVRSMHPKMGAKKMYKLLQPEGIGRDLFIEIYTEAGFSVKTERNFQKTTQSIPSLRYKNLTSNLNVNDVNQLWTSDITYLQIGFKSYLYLVLIMDVYSRKIIGYNASNTLEASSNIKALKMALKERGVAKYTNLIHHSDKGVQYTSNKYTTMLNDYGIKISMCNSVYENIHIERVNGTIKNEYLKSYSIKNLTECQRALKKSVYVYNYFRPHWNLDLKTPDNIENELKNIPISERINLQFYSDEKERNHLNFKQGELFF